MANLAPFNRVQAFQVVAAAGTPQSAPVETDISFAPGEVVGIEIDIPDGHAGLTGLQIATAHQQLFPYTRGQWLIGNDDKIEWAVHDLADTGNWQAIWFNTDLFVHDFYIRFLVSDNRGVARLAPFPSPLPL